MAPLNLIKKREILIKTSTISQITETIVLISDILFVITVILLILVCHNREISLVYYAKPNEEIDRFCSL
jgi:hypothetical protein